MIMSIQSNLQCYDLKQIYMQGWIQSQITGGGANERGLGLAIRGGGREEQREIGERGKKRGFGGQKSSTS